MIQQTSILANRDIKKELGKRQALVYNALKGLESANNTILSRKLGIPINQITPRINELRKDGLVIPECIRQCPITHRMTWFWRVK